VACLLGGQIVSDLAAVACRYVQAPILKGELDEQALQTIEQLDTLAQVANIARLALYFATVICFLVWLHRVHKNLRALGSESLKMTPGQAVGRWFIPFVNLVHGYQSVRHAWVESQPAAVLPSGQVLARSTPLLGLWWAFYIINNLVSRAEPTTVATVDAFMNALPIWTISSVIHAVAGTLAIVVVLRLERRQRETWDDMQRRIPVDPPSDRLR
jgi:hypothetical protein